MMATLLVALAASVAQAELKGEVFSELERQIIQRYILNRNAHYGEDQVSHTHKHQRKNRGKNKAKGKRKKTGLPPGLARREALPPGLKKREFPADLRQQLPKPPPGVERIFVDGRAVLIEKATSKVLDVIKDIVLR